MKKNIIFLSLVFVSLFVLFTGCSKDDEKKAPTLVFKTGTGYTSADATINYNDTVLVGIQAASNGSDNIVKLTLYANEQLMLDSTVNVIALDLNFYLIKSIASSDTWKFTVTDAAGKFTDLTIVLSRETAISTFNTITLGAQYNTTDKEFLSAIDGVLYNQDEAFNNQSKIDIFCFYEAASGNNIALASPGTGITGIFTGATAPENYTTMNTTFFVKTSLTPAEFDNYNDDQNIINAFNPDNKYRKAKNLQADEVYAFQIESGKYGMFKVISVVPDSIGSATLAIKIQQ